MIRLNHVWMIAIMALVLSTAWGQDTSAPPEGSSAPPQDSSAQQPIPAYGQGNAAPISENPPISGLDQPGLEPHGAPLSYIQPGATVSESWDSNIENTLGGGPGQSITRALGSLALQRLWSRYGLALQYGGGVAYYNEKGVGWKLLQQLDVDQKVTWKRGQLSLRDSFSYLPEGNFGGSYGSLGSQGIASVGDTSFSNFWGGSAFGTLGLVPRVMNLTVADVEQNLSPKSAVTAAAGYDFTHFYGNDPITGISYLNNSQISAQVGYNRIVTPHTQIAMVYGYQGFDFSSIGTAFHSHIIQGLVGHRISGRMDFLIGAGPQFTNIGVACTTIDVLTGNPHCGISASGNPTGTIPDFRIGVAANAKLRYRFPKTEVDLSYQRYQTSGSGFFAGAQTDVARVKLNRPISRVWGGFADGGYSRNRRLQTAVAGVEANSYSYGFVGFGLHRAFGHDFHGFASYQFNRLAFDDTFCAGVSPCNSSGNRNVITIGLDWTPRPLRID
jgi:hypothetical protein